MLALHRREERWALQALAATGAPVSPPRELSVSAAVVVGARSDRDAVALTRTSSWGLVDSANGAELTRGTTRPFLALAPDLHRVAIIDRGVGQVSRLYVSTRAALRDRSRSLGDAEVAAWSPDGRRIAAIARVDGRNVLVVLDPETGVRRDVGPVGFALGPPVWLDDHRVAVPRGDQATYDWIDVDGGGGRGQLLDHRLGQVYKLERSAADGTLAVIWNRNAVLETWIIPPGEPPFALRAAHLSEVHRWSPDGEVLWIQSSPSIYRYDRATRQLSREPALDLPPQTAIFDLLPLSRDRVLIQTVTTTSDLVRAISSR